MLMKKREKLVLQSVPVTRYNKADNCNQSNVADQNNNVTKQHFKKTKESLQRQGIQLTGQFQNQ